MQPCGAVVQLAWVRGQGSGAWGHGTLTWGPPPTWAAGWGPAGKMGSSQASFACMRSGRLQHVSVPGTWMTIASMIWGWTASTQHAAWAITAPAASLALPPPLPASKGPEVADMAGLLAGLLACLPACLSAGPSSSLSPLSHQPPSPPPPAPVPPLNPQAHVPWGEEAHYALLSS